VAVGDDDGTVLGGRLTAGDDLGLHGDGPVEFALADFDEAHAAAGDDGEGRVPAVVWDEHARFLGRLNQVQALVVAHLDLFAVDRDLRHVCDRFPARFTDPAPPSTVPVSFSAPRHRPSPRI